MNGIWGFFFTRKKTEEERLLEILSQTQVFADLPKKVLKQLLPILHERHYRPGETVFSIGEPGIGMYIICEGEVSVYVHDPLEEDPGEHRESIVATLGKGEFFGDVALFTESLRSATIRAIQTTRLLALLRPDFLYLIKREPALGCDVLRRLLSIAGQRLEYVNHELVQTRKELALLRTTFATRPLLPAVPARQPLDTPPPTSRSRVSLASVSYDPASLAYVDRDPSPTSEIPTFQPPLPSVSSDELRGTPFLHTPPPEEALPSGPALLLEESESSLASLLPPPASPGSETFGEERAADETLGEERAADDTTSPVTVSFESVGSEDSDEKTRGA